MSDDRGGMDPSQRRGWQEQDGTWRRVAAAGSRSCAHGCGRGVSHTCGACGQQICGVCTPGAPGCAKASAQAAYEAAEKGGAKAEPPAQVCHCGARGKTLVRVDGRNEWRCFGHAPGAP